MSQGATLLKMLREEGKRGVSVHDLIYKRGITRAAAIVHQLRERGYDIQTVDEGAGRLARYVLVAWPNGEPNRPPAPPTPPPDDPVTPASAGKPVEFWCGCARSADGKTWLNRCAADTRGEVSR